MTTSLLLNPPSGSRWLQKLQRLWSQRPNARLPQRVQQPADAAVVPPLPERDEYGWLVPARPFQTSFDAGLFNPAGRWLA